MTERPAESKHPASSARPVDQPGAIGAALDFDLEIDRDAEVPIGVQLAWALRTRIRDGRFEPSQRLPGLRDLAEAIGVNVNTVRAVYQRLEHEGLINSQQGSGTFVAPTSHRPSAVGAIAADAAREAQATGVDPREVAAALYVASEPPARPADEAAERRRLLRVQIAGLERTLGELEAGHPGLLPTSAAPREGPGPRLLGAGELEQVRTSLVRRLTAVQMAIDALGRGDTPGGTSGVTERQEKHRAATTNKRTGRSPIGRPPAKPRPAAAGA
jgi:DNA-binding transcriptional regulator YhcF (GntR family)